MRLAFTIALRFLTTSKTQTMLILLGIAVGVSVQVYLGSLIQGLQKDLVNATIGRSSHITITSDNSQQTIQKADTIMQQVQGLSKNVQNISTATDASGFLQFRENTEPILMRGFSLAIANHIYQFEETLKDGNLPQKDYEVMLGVDLAKEVSVKVGDFVLIRTPQGITERVRVSGLFDYEVAQINKTWVITTTRTVQDIFGFGNRVTAIEMQIDEVFEARTIDAIFEKYFVGEEWIIDNWMDQNAPLLGGLRGQSVSSFMIQFFVIIAVTLGIASVLAVSVVQRSKQIGILKAIGIFDVHASMIFVIQGFILGVLGAMLGIFFGFGLIQLFKTFAKNPDGTPVVPILLNVSFIALSGTIAILASVLASLVPAKLSLRLNPIEVIRNA